MSLFVEAKGAPRIGGFGSTFVLKAFAPFSRLWAMQRDYRDILVKSQYCGLQRWQIGDIAYKIAQLYYKVYILTSDTRYLAEAESFFEAISARGYFLPPKSDPANNALGQADAADIAQIRLRFLARYIVVEMMMRRPERLAELAAEFETLARADRTWIRAADNLQAFLRADGALKVPASPDAAAMERSASGLSIALDVSSGSADGVGLRLREAVVVCGAEHHTHFFELTLETLWMIRALERMTSAPPRKYLLAGQPLEQALLYMAAAGVSAAEGGPDDAVLVYVCGDADGDDVALTSRTACQRLRPADLTPFLRRPTVLVLESSAARPFARRVFDLPDTAPLLVLAAAPDTGALPPRLLTCFLASSVRGTAAVVGCNVRDADAHEDLCDAVADALEVARAALDTNELAAFLGDSLLASLIMRAVLMRAILRAIGAPDSQLPTIHPSPAADDFPALLEATQRVVKVASTHQSPDK